MINNEDFTQYTEQRTLRITREVKNYHAELELFLPLNLFAKIQPSVDLRIYNGAKLLFGGLIYRVKYGRLITDGGVRKRKISLTVENYGILLTRRTISEVINLEPTDPNNPANDTNTAGRYFREVLMSYLTEEGITEGEIGEGARLAEALDVYEFDTMSIKEIADVLSGLTGESYYIDIAKALNFASDDLLADVYDTTEYKLTETNHNYYDIEMEKTLEGYINKVFVRGSHPDEDLSEEYMDYDGKIKYIQQNSSEIARMGLLNSDSGVWGKVVTDDRILYLETAQKRAEIEMLKHGKMPVIIFATTPLDVFKPGDKILAELTSWNLPLQTLTVKSITIEFNKANTLEHRLELINNEIIDDGVFSDVVMNQGLRISNTNNAINALGEIVNSGGIVTPTIPIPTGQNLKLWVDVQNDEAITYGTENNVTSIKDAITKATAFSQLDATKKPEVVLSDGKKWLSFNHLNEENLNAAAAYQVGTAFVVFKDTSSAEEYTYGAPLGENYQGGVMGEMFGGGSALRSALMVNGIATEISTQQRIRGIKTLATLITKAENLGDTDVQLLNIGKNASSSSFTSYYTGLVAEVIVYDSILNQTEIDAVNSYLMGKYGIQ